MSGVGFDMTPVLRLGDWCFTNRTISIATFVVTDKIWMDCQIARATNCWYHTFSPPIRTEHN
jgi:hypothetical protein